MYDDPMVWGTMGDGYPVYQQPAHTAPRLHPNEAEPYSYADAFILLSKYPGAQWVNAALVDKEDGGLRAEVHRYCHDPSHGGFYMAKGALYIRIGLPPHIVSGDCLVSPRYGLTARSLHCRHAYPMSRDWGCTSTCCRSLYVPISSMRPWRLYLHSHVRPLSW